MPRLADACNGCHSPDPAVPKHHDGGRCCGTIRHVHHVGGCTAFNPARNPRRRPRCPANCASSRAAGRSQLWRCCAAVYPRVPWGLESCAAVAVPGLYSRGTGAPRGAPSVGPPSREVTLRLLSDGTCLCPIVLVQVLQVHLSFALAIHPRARYKCLNGNRNKPYRYLQWAAKTPRLALGKEHLLPT